MPLAVMGIGVQELVIILLIVVFLFGARRIPELFRGLGEGIRGFRTGLRGDDEAAPPTERERDASRPDRGDRGDG